MSATTQQSVYPGDKRLNEINRLADMGHFPAAVNAGATVNVLLTLVATWWLVPRFPEPWAPMAWVALVLGCNLLPVVVLRAVAPGPATYARVREMSFVHDQHRFSDWVYLAASANMAFWVLTGWAVFSVWHMGAVLAAALVIAAVATFAPVWLRGGR